MQIFSLSDKLVLRLNSWLIYFMRRKIIFYMCNNFISFQVICSLFPPTQTYAASTLQRKVFHTVFMLENAGILHILIFEYLKNVPFPVSFKQLYIKKGYDRTQNSAEELECFLLAFPIC